MTWLDRFAALICPHRRDVSAKVNAAFDRMQAARAQVAVAASETKASAEAHSAEVEQERSKIRARTAETAARWPTGKTSEVRALVEEALNTLDKKSAVLCSNLR